jgi:hypothetical protein
MSVPLDVIGLMRLLGPWFPGGSWGAWYAIMKGAFALPMSDAEIELFFEVSRRAPPKRRVKELWVIGGRRGGKDSAASLMAAHAAITFDQEGKLRPGERAVVLCVACDRDQSRIVLGYIKSYFNDVPALKANVRRETSDGIELNNGIDIVVGTNNYRSVRGRAVLLAILDECAFFKSETSASPDIETYRAITPGMATLRGSMLVGISSPYRPHGLLYGKFQKHFGKDDSDILVIRAPSLTLNPTLDRGIVEQALEDDPAAARAEWLAEFRADVAGFADIALIEAAVDRNVTIRPPRPGIMYTSFCDVSGGVRDSAACAVTHLEDDVAVLDNLLEVKAPFNPTVATQQICGTLKAYGLGTTVGDRYGAQWTVDAFAKCGIRYEHSERDRSALYLDALPLFTSGRARLLDNKRLVTQFASLERRTGPSGRDRVDHGPGGHDDLCNAAAGALVAAVSNPGINWSAADDIIAALARMRGRSGFAGVMPGDPAFPHRWNARHLG